LWCRRRNTFRTALYVFAPSKPVFHGTISIEACLARAPAELAMEPLANWAGPSKHFLVFPVRYGTMVNYVGFRADDEEMKESWSAPGDPRAAPRVRRLGPAHGNVLQQVDKTFRWRSTTVSRYRLDKGRLTLLGDAAHRCCASRSGANQSIETHGARDVLAQADTSPSRRRSLPTSDCVASVCGGSLAPGRMDCVSIPPRPISVSAMQSSRAREFRKHLYAYDVVPDARAAAAALLQ